MKIADWMGVIIIFALLYLLNRLVSFIGLWYGFFYGDIVLMIVIIFLACCILGSSGERLSDSFERRVIAKRDEKLAHKTKLDLIKTQYYEENRTIQDIANDLGVSMMTVRKYIDEIDEIEKTKY